MKIGLDLDNTLTAFPEFFLELVTTFLERGHEFYITSNRSLNQWPEYQKRLTELGFPQEVINQLDTSLMYPGEEPKVPVGKGRDWKIGMAEQLDIVFDDDAWRFQDGTKTPIFQPPRGNPLSHKHD